MGMMAGSSGCSRTSVVAVAAAAGTARDTEPIWRCAWQQQRCGKLFERCVCSVVGDSTTKAKYVLRYLDGSFVSVDSSECHISVSHQCMCSMSYQAQFIDQVVNGSLWCANNAMTFANERQQDGKFDVTQAVNAVHKTVVVVGLGHLDLESRPGPPPSKERLLAGGMGCLPDSHTDLGTDVETRETVFGRSVVGWQACVSVILVQLCTALLCIYAWV